MSDVIESGKKVEYKCEGKWLKGVVHGVRHYELNNILKKITYLIDTGKEHPDHVGRKDRQPELVEINQKFVKTI